MICSSGIGFDPLQDGKRLTFGFEGIWKGTAVLYDHQTKSLWMHLTGACFAGPLAGKRLERLATGRHTTWADWRALHPATDVLALEPELVGRSPDEGYFAREGARSGQAFLPAGFRSTLRDVDPSRPPQTLLYGVVAGGKARAYLFEDLARQSVVHESLGGVEATVWFDAASRSAAAFDCRRGASVHRFERSPAGAIRDVATQSTWTLDGRCSSGALEGAQLTPLNGLMSEWYGWSAHHPETTVWKP